MDDELVRRARSVGAQDGTPASIPENFTSLHIIVVSIRCEALVPLLPVSRQGDTVGV